MNRRAFPWSRLGIDPTSDKAAIRKAYADALRATNVDEDIAGYADLRRARDQALWLAAQGEQALAGEEEDEGAIYGLGALDDGDDLAPEVGDWDEDDGHTWDIAPGIQQALSGPSDYEEQAPPLTEAQQRAQEAWNTLLAIMYPGGEASEEAVTHAEFDAGLAALGVLIARAEDADLEEHDALDGALAELFARTWPRSSPFVEPANAAFHWLDEAGSLEERPALMFLNQRLKGMRFHEKVQQPDHPLHKAWAELARPGRATLFDRMRVKRLDVHKLLTGIRERYPELETFLDPERIASWDGDSASLAEGRTSAGRGFSRVLLFVVVVFAALRVFANIMGSDSAPGDDPPVAEAAAAYEAVLNDTAVAAVFGEGVTMAQVRAADPVFAGDLRKVIKAVGSQPSLVLAHVRLKALQSDTVADFDGLVTRGELRRLWLAAALPSPQQCREVLTGDFVTQPLTLDAAAREREARLLKQLLEAKFLSSDGRREGGTFSVPGWVIDETIAKSGLGEEAVDAALRDPQHAARCQLELTLLGVMLKEPGKISADLLRAL
jgi:hypothetical protein